MGARVGGMANPKDVLGRRGEDLAAEHLVAAGLVLVERNWRCRDGEIDLIALEPAGPTLVFCEVKTRSSAAFGLPVEAVGRMKSARLRRLASQWLHEHDHVRADVRFDVVGVLCAPGAAPVLQHLQGAF